MPFQNTLLQPAMHKQTSVVFREYNFRGLLADVLQCSMPPSGGMYGAQTMSFMCLVSVNSPKRQQREALRQGVTGQQLEDKHNIEA